MLQDVARCIWATTQVLRRNAEVRNAYPVGYVRELVMRPMDFEEYCWAAGITEGALESVHSAFEAKEPLPEYLHDAMLNNYRTYMVVGGMPEAVKAFRGVAR